jgi:hypothetical protein
LLMLRTKSNQAECIVHATLWIRTQRCARATLKSVSRCLGRRAMRRRSLAL